MDGENNGKPYEQMDDLGVPIIFGNTHIAMEYPHVQQEIHLHSWPIFHRCVYRSVYGVFA